MNEQSDDPDMQDNACYYSSGRGNDEIARMPPVIAELHDQLTGEVDRLHAMMKASLGALYAPGGYARASEWIATKDKHGERSEFSKRLAKARALFEALAALETTMGVPSQTTGGYGPWPYTSQHEGACEVLTKHKAGKVIEISDCTCGAWR